jgi:hypothetical protein
MAEVRAYLNPSDLDRMMRALNKLEATAKRLENDFPRKNSIDYAMLLRQNIHSQKHMSGYPPYNERYAEWKEQYALYDEGYWKAMGSLVSAITFWKEQHGRWRSGVPEGAYDTGGTSWFGTGAEGEDKPIAMYARTIEYGLGKQPERPIFRPTLKEYKATKYMERGREAIRELKRQWR